MNEKQYRYVVRQYSDFPNRYLTDREITSFDVLKDAQEFTEEYNIQKDTDAVAFDRNGNKYHIGNYIHSPNERYYIDDMSKYDVI
jgi:hypothetical protein